MDDISLSLSAKLLKFAYPHAKGLIRLIQKGNGYINLPPAVIDLMTREGLPPWATMYEDPLRLRSVLIYALLGHKGAALFAKRLEGVSERHLLRYRKILMKCAIKLDEDGFFEELANIRPARPDVYQRWLRRLTPEQKTDHWKDVYLVLYALISNYINTIAIMTVGASMCDLVARAKTGDEDAFCQAVQIDKSVLTGISYFRKRLDRAALGNEPEFLHKLSLKLQERPVAGKIKHKTLLIMVAALDEEGFSQISKNRKYEILSDIGVYGPKHHQYDVDSLRKILSRYSERTGREIRI